MVSKTDLESVVVVGRRAEHPVRNALILSGVLLSATVAVILAGADESVEVVTGFLPSRFVHLDSIEAAVANFFRNPKASSFGPEG
jgi:hypothetical protein